MAIRLKENGLPEGSGLYWKDEKRTQIWIRISHNGVAKSYPSGTAQWKEALRVRDGIKADLLKGDRKQATNRVIRINELLDDYLAELRRKQGIRGEYGTDTARNAELMLNKHVRPHFGSMRAANLTTADLNAYRDKRIAQYRAAGKAEGTWVIAINREFALLRAAMRLGMKATPKKVVSYPAFPIDAKAEKLRARKGVVTPEQFRSLMAAAPDHLKPVIPLVTYAGVRAKELKFIRREQVDWENRLIHLRDGETKEGVGRDVPIVDVAAEPLRAWMEVTSVDFPGCQWVFHYKGQRVLSWKKAWSSTCAKAGLVAPRLNADGKPKLGKNGKPIMRNLVQFHDTRRTAVTIHGRAGVTESDSQRVTGHSTVEVHRRYDQDRDAAIRTREAVNAYLSGQVTPDPVSKKTNNIEAQIQKVQALAQVVAMYEKGLISESEYTSLKAGILT